MQTDAERQKTNMQRDITQFCWETKYFEIALGANQCTFVLVIITIVTF